MRVIVTADDFGKSRSRNKAIDYAIKNGICYQTSLGVNFEYAEEAYNYANRGGYCERVTYHFNLAEGYPLTNDIVKTCLCESNGKLRWPGRRVLLKHYFDKEFECAVREEVGTQIEKYFSYGFNQKHIDAHCWSFCDFTILKIIKPLLKEYGFETIRPMVGHFMDSSRYKLYYLLLSRCYEKLGLKTASWSGCFSEFLKSDHGGLPEIYIHPDIIDDVMVDYLYSYSGESIKLDKLKEILKEFEMTGYNSLCRN